MLERTIVARYTRGSVLALFSLFVFVSFVSPVHAEGCGDIVAPENWTDNTSLGPSVSTAVASCDDPFGISTEYDNPYTLTIEGQTLTPTTTSIFIESDTFSDITYRGRIGSTMAKLHAFKHTDSGYEYVQIEPNEPLISDEVSFAETYFTSEDIRNFYVGIISADDPYEYFYNDEDELLTDSEGEIVQNRYYDFKDAFDNMWWSQEPVLEHGTYTFVWVAHWLFQTKSNPTFLEKIRNIFVPTAYASMSVPPLIFTQTITVGPVPVTPTGASSVLFLPGIQASRLYTDGLLGTEDQLWTPTWNQDVNQLRMTETGESVEDVYTRDILDEVLGLGTVYKQFSNSLDTLVTDEIIVDWEAYAYDWRYAVDDIVQEGTQHENEVKDVVILVESLAEDSSTNKVTIVAHSNGGLLAKSLMTELQRLGKSDLIDNLVLVASPQLGTPKAIGSMLHGFDQEAAGGIVIDAGVARGVIRNMPGAYGLLPVDEYFDEVGQPIVKFGEGDSLQIFRDKYGDNIDTALELGQFLTGSIDQRPDAVSVYDAEKLNQTLYGSSASLHSDELQPWQAPASTKVFEVVGVGLPTVSGFEYKEFLQRVCTTEFFTETCVDKKYYKPIPIFSLYGDQTVMAQSAKGYQGDKETYFVDLLLQRQQNPADKFNHANITESSAIQQAVSKIIKGEEMEDIQFLSTSAVVQSVEYELLSVHSPAVVHITDNTGNVTEIHFSGEDFVQKKEDIPGSSIYYMGSTTYIVLPTSGEYQLELEGTGPGGVTITIDSLADEVSSNRYWVRIPDTQQGMKIHSVFEDGELAPLAVDVTGDGSVDYMIDGATGQITDASTPAPAPMPVTSTKTGTKIKEKDRPTGAVVGLSTAGTVDFSMESYYKQMYVLLQKLQVLLYEYEKSLK